MAGAFGKNRLATGFVKPSIDDQTTNIRSHGVSSGQNDVHNKLPTGASASSAIELSDDEDMGDSEGGIVLNVEDLGRDGNNMHEDAESGEVSDDQMSMHSAMEHHTNDRQDGAAERLSFVIDPTSIHTTKRLSDLSPAQQEEQIKYAFYHLNRDEIDLNRPVICLKCFNEGHLKHVCQQQTIFPAFKPAVGRLVKLWISCCICASKDHLVGDCTRADKVASERWSLAHLDRDQIINLNLESGIRKLEKAADNRGMRPEGLSIKGRAGRHTAGFGGQDDFESSDDNTFERFSKRARIDGSQYTRYDRFDGPVQSPNNRRGGWYGTDSFGRRRSQSPSQTYRPVRDRRSPSPRQNMHRPEQTTRPADTYRPTGATQRGASTPKHNAESSRKANAATARDANGKAPTSKKLPPPPIPKPNIQFELPTRKGSNTWTSESSAANSTSTPVTNNQELPRRARKPNKPRRNRKPKPG